ncbi:MAG: sulfite exporter TauE/SafE family protein, partial [Deltaproteobacteria bacterium]|nr:sulfite exporter TauE/SafE family protein [Deltaproteobacteria bacterium]
MSIGGVVFLFAASVLAGAVNAVAGGGTLLSFPAAMAAGLSPVVANATNAVAMVPGSLAAAWTFRRYLKGLGGLTAALAVPAIVGALLGAMILRNTPQRLFDGIVPWLVLGATVIILVQGLAVRRVPPGSKDATTPASASASASVPTGRQTMWPLVLGLQLLVSIYGGYFGAAMGIIMLAFLGHVAIRGGGDRLSLHQMNAVKNVLAVIINGTASIDFMVHGLVRPIPALLMAGGAITGGVVG